ncbi:MAG TPA: hypothetical protein VM283_09200 [Armatimonadota bacterium]|nr:hypothetical protein [Armatimonadota bacterium]
MSGASERGGAAVTGPVAMHQVAELDAAEREAIRAGDWARLGHVLDQQRELWRTLMCEAQAAGDDGPRKQAMAAIVELHQVRRRNHELISAQAGEFRRRLAGLRQTQEGRAAYHEVVRRPM